MNANERNRLLSWTRFKEAYRRWVKDDETLDRMHGASS